MSEFLQCPHEVIEATCVGVCNCACEGCEPTRKHTPPRERRRPVVVERVAYHVDFEA